jgi:hypothetical protein
MAAIWDSSVAARCSSLKRNRDRKLSWIDSHLPSGITPLLQAAVLLGAAEQENIPGWAATSDSSVAVDQAVLTVRIISWMGSHLG